MGVVLHGYDRDGWVGVLGSEPITNGVAEGLGAASPDVARFLMFIHWVNLSMGVSNGPSGI